MSHEDLKDYLKPTGNNLHPVSLNDVLTIGTHKAGYKFKSIHKLGNGTFGTVWLAENHYFKSQPEQKIPHYVALKIVEAETADNVDVQEREHDVMEQLASNTHLPNSCYIMRCYDTCTYKGPNGKHDVHILELIGPSLLAVMGRAMEDRNTWFGGRSFKERLQLLCGLAQAVEFLHSQGIVHGGMYSPSISHPPV